MAVHPVPLLGHIVSQIEAQQRLAITPRAILISPRDRHILLTEAERAGMYSRRRGQTEETYIVEVQGVPLVTVPALDMLPVVVPENAAFTFVALADTLRKLEQAQKRSEESQATADKWAKEVITQQHRNAELVARIAALATEIGTLRKTWWIRLRTWWTLQRHRAVVVEV